MKIGTLYTYTSIVNQNIYKDTVSGKFVFDRPPKNDVVVMLLEKEVSIHNIAENQKGSLFLTPNGKILWIHNRRLKEDLEEVK